MAENKTQKTTALVEDYLTKISPQNVQSDCRALLAMMEKHTKQKAAMWGTSLVGVGDIQYANSAGKVTDWFPVGFSARKAAISVYLCSGLAPLAEELEQLGPHKTGVGCLYIKNLESVDRKVLEKMIKKSIAIKLPAAVRKH